MLNPEIEIGQKLGEVYLREYSEAFFVSALRNKKEIEEALETRFAKFFYEIRALIGVDHTPARIGARGVQWADTTPEWKVVKFDRGSSGINDNDFYRGLTGGYAANLKGLDPNDEYGAPKIVIGTLKAQGKTKAGKGFRVSPGSVAIRGNRLTHKGRFASASGLFHLKMELQAFPELKTAEDIIEPFDERTQKIMKANEFAGIKKKNPRPFIIPMANYYAQVALPHTFFRNAR